MKLKIWKQIIPMKSGVQIHCQWDKLSWWVTLKYFHVAWIHGFAYSLYAVTPRGICFPFGLNIAHEGGVPIWFSYSPIHSWTPTIHLPSLKLISEWLLRKMHKNTHTCTPSHTYAKTFSLFSEICYNDYISVSNCNRSHDSLTNLDMDHQSSVVLPTCPSDIVVSW